MIIGSKQKKIGKIEIGNKEQTQYIKYLGILYLKFKLSNQNIVFIPRNEVISHCISLLKWDTTESVADLA